eukprot:scaffold289100_cov22-Tisochrysis_lutea.AAC.3
MDKQRPTATPAMPTLEAMVNFEGHWSALLVKIRPATRRILSVNPTTIGIHHCRSGIHHTAEHAAKGLDIVQEHW